MEAGANLNASDCHFGTPLHITANQGFVKSGVILLRAGMMHFIHSIKLFNIHLNSYIPVYD